MSVFTRLKLGVNERAFSLILPFNEVRAALGRSGVAGYTQLKQGVNRKVPDSIHPTEVGCLEFGHFY